MIDYQETRVVNYSALKMFDLVKDVEQYDQFIPWCKKSVITKRNKDSFEADLYIGYQLLSEKFTSKVYLNYPKIYIESLNGPLKSLYNEWHFKEITTNQCQISFSVKFEFKNFLLQNIANIFFNQVLKKMITALENRAKTIK